MHLTTSRIGTLEPFSVFFILFMFLYMIRYYYTGFYDTPLKEQMKLLCLSGIMMGLGIATKWTACYSAVGLAIILFSNLFQRWREYNTAMKKLRRPRQLSPRERQLCTIIRDVFMKHLFITILWCFVFFIFIPIIIYWVSYIPTHVWRDGYSIANVWKQIMYIYNYHINLEATHPYQSTWYQWILDLRPIWYFGKADSPASAIPCCAGLGSSPSSSRSGMHCVTVTVKLISSSSVILPLTFHGYRWYSAAYSHITSIRQACS